MEIEVHMFVKKSRSSGRTSGDGDSGDGRVNDSIECIGCWSNQTTARRQTRRDGRIDAQRQGHRIYVYIYVYVNIYIVGLFDVPPAPRGGGNTAWGQRLLWGNWEGQNMNSKRKQDLVLFCGNCFGDKMLHYFQKT